MMEWEWLGWLLLPVAFISGGAVSERLKRGLGLYWPLFVLHGALLSFCWWVSPAVAIAGVVAWLALQRLIAILTWRDRRRWRSGRVGG